MIFLVNSSSAFLKLLPYIKIIFIFYDSITSIFTVFIDMSKYTIKSEKNSQVVYNTGKILNGKCIQCLAILCFFTISVIKYFQV